MRLYHGTTIENLKSIKIHGLRRGTWCSPDFESASKYAKSRSKWNGYNPVIISLWANAKRIRINSKGEKECQTLKDITSFNVAQIS